MRRLLPLTVILALAACGKSDAPSGGGGESTPPVTADQSGPSDPGPIDPATVGTITGTVRLEGWLKPDGNVPMDSIPYCAAQHKEAVVGDTLVLGDGQTMANVLVYVKSGLGRRKFPVATTPKVLDQVGCLYKPHVISLMVNQPLVIHNNDDILHNVHGYPKLSAPFNDGQATKGLENTYKIPVAEPDITVKCDVHPWMGAIIHVIPHPFHVVTERNGTFTLSGLPPGEYVIEARHERFAKAPLVAQVKVGAKETVKQDFVFKGGAKPDSK